VHLRRLRRGAVSQRKQHRPVGEWRHRGEESVTSSGSRQPSNDPTTNPAPSARPNSSVSGTRHLPLAIGPIARQAIKGAVATAQCPGGKNSLRRAEIKASPATWGRAGVIARETPPTPRAAPRHPGLRPYPRDEHLAATPVGFQLHRLDHRVLDSEHSSRGNFEVEMWGSSDCHPTVKYGVMILTIWRRRIIHTLSRRAWFRPAHQPLARSPTDHSQPPPNRENRPSRPRSHRNRKRPTTHILLRSPQ
jgi:hypothetical protein